MANAYATVRTVAWVELAAIAGVLPRARARCGGAVGGACSVHAAALIARVNLIALATLPAGSAAARAPIGRTCAMAGAAGRIGTRAVVCTPHDCHAGKHTTQHTSG